MCPSGPNGICSTTWTCPSVSLDSNPIDYGGWSGAGVGLVNGIYGAIYSGLEIGAMMADGPRTAQAVTSTLPSSLAVGNSGS